MEHRSARWTAASVARIEILHRPLRRTPLALDVVGHPVKALGCPVVPLLLRLPAAGQAAFQCHTPTRPSAMVKPSSPSSISWYESHSGQRSADPSS